MSTKEHEKAVAKLLDHPFFKKDEYEPSESYNDMAMSVKYRIQALRKLQLDEIIHRQKYEQQVLKLQEKYFNDLQNTFARRAKIINGSYEPGNSELLVSVTDDVDYKPSKTVCGVTNFWLQVLKNVPLVEPWIESYDEPLLQKLKDIKITFPDSIEKQLANGDGATAIPPAGLTNGSVTTDDVKETSRFSIEFDFGKNEYFHNEKLTKTYTVQTTVQDNDSPFNYVGTDIIGAEGTEIQWKSADHNLTSKMVSKKQKNAKTGKTRVVKKQEKQESFFNFFTPPKRPENDDAVMDEDEGQTLLEEIEIDENLGIEFRDKIVPYATLIFTEEYDDSDEEDSDDEDSSDDEFTSEEGSDEEDQDDQEANPENPECKQQ